MPGSVSSGTMRSGWVIGPKYPCARRARGPGPVAPRAGVAAFDCGAGARDRPFAGRIALLGRACTEAALGGALRRCGSRGRLRAEAPRPLARLRSRGGGGARAARAGVRVVVV